MSEHALRALEGVRVLELGHGIAGPYAARLLGDLGAEVVKVEPPKGEYGRRIGPQQNGGTDAGLLFEFLNWNKRGFVLDLGADGAADALRPLVEWADIVIESFSPGRLEAWGFGPHELLAWNDRAVVTSITNFGRTGPRAGWRGSDLVFYAMSGVMHMSGKKLPREPIKHGLRQSMYAAGLNAAYASLVGYLAAGRYGHGTHIDLSIQECVASEQITPLSYYIFTGLIPGRQPATEDPFGGDPIDMPGGKVSIQAPPACPMSRWADFLGMELLREPAYARTVGRVRDAALIRHAVEQRLREYPSAKQFFLDGSRAGMIVALAQDASDLLECAQLRERGLFQPLPGRAEGDVRVPVELARLSQTPVAVTRPAPGIGEHNAEILAEVATATARGTAGGAATAPAEPNAPTGPPLPLAGLRVVDLSNVVAGPYMGALLADLGADVIKIEGPTRLDPARITWGPLVDNEPGDEPWNRGGAFQILNRGKRSFVCDLSKPEGLELLKRLLAESDVLIENFTPRVLRNWGLTPEALANINPRLITVSNSGYGATGPWRDFRAQGTTLEVMMGISAYTGYPDGRPTKAGQSYPDFVACWSGLVAVLAALVHRERTGLGQWIDQGMYQVGAALIPEAILQVQADGSDLGRRGAEDFDSVCSGVFPSAVEDRWVAVSLTDLGQLVDIGGYARREGLPPMALPDGVDAAEGRAALAEWIRRFDAEVAAAHLQAAGVAAGTVMSVAELVHDEHLLRRGFYEPVDFGDGEHRPVMGRPYRLGGYGAHVGGRAPRFGEHNREILARLGVDGGDGLESTGVIADHPARPAGAAQVDIDVLIGPEGSFAGAHRDYLGRLRARRVRAEELETEGTQ